MEIPSTSNFSEVASPQASTLTSHSLFKWTQRPLMSRPDVTELPSSQTENRLRFSLVARGARSPSPRRHPTSLLLSSHRPPAGLLTGSTFLNCPHHFPQTQPPPLPPIPADSALSPRHTHTFRCLALPRRPTPPPALTSQSPEHTDRPADPGPHRLFGRGLRSLSPPAAGLVRASP